MRKKTVKILDEKVNQLIEKLDNIPQINHVIQQLDNIKELVTNTENKVKKNDIVKTVISSDNKNNADTKNKKMTKSERYKKEREEFVNELEQIMGLSESNRGVLLYDLEHNEPLNKYLKDKIVDIQKFYKCGTWNYFVKQHQNNGDVDEISLIKSIFKNEGYEVITKKKISERNGIKKQYVNLNFLKIYKNNL